MIGRGWNRLKCRVAEDVCCVSDYIARVLIVIIYLLGKHYIKY
jgi:hypothetical protein